MTKTRKQRKVKRGGEFSGKQVDPVIPREGIIEQPTEAINITPKEEIIEQPLEEKDPFYMEEIRDAEFDRPTEDIIYSKNSNDDFLKYLIIQMEEPSDNGGNVMLPTNTQDLVNVLSNYYLMIPYRLQERIKNLRQIVKKRDGSYVKLSIIGVLITSITSQESDRFYDLCLLLLQKARSYLTVMTSFHLTHDDISALAAKWCNSRPESFMLEKLNTIISNLSNVDRASFNSRLLQGCKKYKVDRTTRSQGGKKKTKKTKKRRKL